MMTRLPHKARLCKALEMPLLIQRLGQPFHVQGILSIDRYVAR